MTSPRQPQDDAKTTPRRPKTIQDDPKTNPRRPQDFFFKWTPCFKWTCPAGRPAGQPANQPISFFQMDILFSNGYVHLKKGCPFEKREIGWMAGRPAGWPAGRLASRRFQTQQLQIFRKPKNIKNYSLKNVFGEARYRMQVLFWIRCVHLKKGMWIWKREISVPRGLNRKRCENAAFRLMFLLLRFFKWICLFQMDIPFSNGDVHLKKAPAPKSIEKNIYIFMFFVMALGGALPFFKWRCPFEKGAGTLF